MRSMGVPVLTRKLTTILIADVVGYSRLMARDEEGTHARLAAFLRDLLEPAITSHGGTLIKKTGDGVLAEFPSVVEGIRCAIEIQQGAADRNKGLPPEQHISFRIGVNIGDVIVDADDIYGDGINVAARLEGLADSGAIIVSRAVRDHVRDKLKLDFEDLGEQSVKNIARPVRAFRIQIGHTHGRQDARRRIGLRGVLAGAGVLGLGAATMGGLWWLKHPAASPTLPSASSTASSAPPVANVTRASRLSIVVLPFTNLSCAPREDYFADGITESLTTDLSRVLPGSFVVARGTAFGYRGKPIDTSQVSRDLNVRYVLRGSVLPAGDRVRVNAQLIDTQTDTELWAERFDKMRKDVLELQDQIVGRLSSAVGLQVVDIEAERSEL